MLDESNRRTVNFYQNLNLNEYEQTINEIKSSEKFWGKNRNIDVNWYRIIVFGISAFFIAMTFWFIFMNLFNDEFLSNILTITVFVMLSIFLQPQVLSRIQSSFSSLEKATIEDVDLSKDIRLFFYRDVDTEKLYDDILFVEKNGRLAAFGMFKIDTVPIGISGKFNQFIRSIYGKKIPIFWNYLQSPITEKEVMRLGSVSFKMREQLQQMRPDVRNLFLLNRDGVWEARIMFGTSVSKKIGTNAINTIQELYDLIHQNMLILESSFIANFPHSKLVQLMGKDIISAIYAQITNGGHFRFF
ncbi:MAG: hypothetical protein ACTSRG_17770 [Candidatus Helarchaeota archaeon]